MKNTAPKIKWQFDKSKLLCVRVKHEMTQREVALKLGKTKQMYHQWESGERTPNIHSLIKLAELYQVRPQYFFVQSVS